MGLYEIKYGPYTKSENHQPQWGVYFCVRIKWEKPIFGAKYKAIECRIINFYNDWKCILDFFGYKYMTKKTKKQTKNKKMTKKIYDKKTKKNKQIIKKQANAFNKKIIKHCTMKIIRDEREINDFLNEFSCH